MWWRRLDINFLETSISSVLVYAYLCKVKTINGNSKNVVSLLIVLLKKFGRSHSFARVKNSSRVTTMRNHFVAVSLVIAFAHAKKFNCCIHIVELTSQLFVITYLGELGLISRHFINCTVYHHAQSKQFSPYAMLQNLFWRTFWEMKKEELLI